MSPPEGLRDSPSGTSNKPRLQKRKRKEKRSPHHGVTLVLPASGTGTPSDFTLAWTLFVAVLGQKGLGGDRDGAVYSHVW